VAVHRDRGIRLTDGDGYVAAGRLVVGVAVKRPVGGAAGYVGEAGPQVQQAAQVFKLHGLGRTRGPVRVAGVHIGVAADVDDGVGLADVERLWHIGRISPSRTIPGLLRSNRTASRSCDVYSVARNGAVAGSDKRYR